MKAINAGKYPRMSGPSQDQFFWLDFWLYVVAECTFYYNGYKNYNFFFCYSFLASEALRRESCCFSLITAPKDLILCIVDCCLFNTTTRTVLQMQCQNSHFQRCAVFPRCFISIPRAPNKHRWVCIYFFFSILEREGLPWEVRSKSSARNLS